MAFTTPSYQDTYEFKTNFQLLVDQLDELQKNPLFLKQANRNLDVRLFVITRDSYADLGETLVNSSPERRKLVSIRPLDTQHLMNNKDKIDELIDRLVWYNENTKTASIMPQKKHKEPKKEIDIDIEVKKRGQPKQAKGTFVGPVKAHTVTKQELDAMNQAAVEFRVNLQLIANPTQVSEGSPKGIQSPKILKQEAVRNPFERVFKSEEEKPASKRRERVEKSKASDKTEREIGTRAKENRQLRKSGEKRKAEFDRQMKKGTQEKERTRDRIAKNKKQ